MGARSLDIVMSRTYPGNGILRTLPGGASACLGRVYWVAASPVATSSVQGLGSGSRIDPLPISIGIQR